MLEDASSLALQLLITTVVMLIFAAIFRVGVKSLRAASFRTRDLEALKRICGTRSVAGGKLRGTIALLIGIPGLLVTIPLFVIALRDVLSVAFG